MKNVKSLALSASKKILKKELLLGKLSNFFPRIKKQRLARGQPKNEKNDMAYKNPVSHMQKFVGVYRMEWNYVTRTSEKRKSKEKSCTTQNFSCIIFLHEKKLLFTEIFPVLFSFTKKTFISGNIFRAITEELSHMLPSKVHRPKKKLKNFQVTQRR